MASQSGFARALIAAFFMLPTTPPLHQLIISSQDIPAIIPQLIGALNWMTFALTSVLDLETAIPGQIHA